jgi:gamma-glutamylcyclotransferase (GGCT)/AIG2-like uncharacterized protein YtfP
MSKFRKLNKLFVYGRLKPQYDHSDNLMDPKKALVKGDLYGFNHDAEAKNLNHSANDVEGYLTKATTAKENELDKIEAPEFKRVPVTTEQGEHADAYEYQKKLPGTAKRMRSWKK